MRVGTDGQRSRGERDARNRRRVKRCPATGKVRFRTKRKAQRAIEPVRAEEHVPLYAYECPHCGDWHMTKQARRK